MGGGSWYYLAPIRSYSRHSSDSGLPFFVLHTSYFAPLSYILHFANSFPLVSWIAPLPHEGAALCTCFWPLAITKKWGLGNKRLTREHYWTTNIATHEERVGGVRKLSVHYDNKIVHQAVINDEDIAMGLHTRRA